MFAEKKQRSMRRGRRTETKRERNETQNIIRPDSPLHSRYSLLLFSLSRSPIYYFIHSNTSLSVSLVSSCESSSRPTVAVATAAAASTIIARSPRPPPPSSSSSTTSPRSSSTPSNSNSNSNSNNNISRSSSSARIVGSVDCFSRRTMASPRGSAGQVLPAVAAKTTKKAKTKTKTTASPWQKKAAASASEEARRHLPPAITSEGARTGRRRVGFFLSSSGSLVSLSPALAYASLF